MATITAPTWENFPSTATPRNATNLNKITTDLTNINNEVSSIDSRVTANEGDISELNNGKLDKLAVKIEKVTSDTDTYGCNYINQIETDIKYNILSGNIVKCNYKVENKDVYIKRFVIDSLPNTGQKYFDTGIPLTTKIHKIEGLYGEMFPINFTFAPNVTYSIGTYIRQDNSTSTTNWVIEIATGSDRSSLDGYIDIYFTNNN